MRKDEVLRTLSDERERLAPVEMANLLEDLS